MTPDEELKLKRKESRHRTYIKNKDKINQQTKEYYENHKQEIAEKGKIYREKNIDKIKEKKNKQSKCICGVIYTQCHKARHEKTQHHINFFQSTSG